MIAMRKLICILSILALSFPTWAQDLYSNLSLRLNRADGVYAKGDTVRVWADVKSIPDGETSFVMFPYTDPKKADKKPVSLNVGENLLLETVYDETVHYSFCVTDGSDAGKGYPKGVYGGFAVAPEEFTPGFEKPEDLEAFWADNISYMRSKKIRETIKSDVTKDGYRVYETEVNCVGPKPLRAYVAHPEDAQPGTLPIILYLHHAGRPGEPSEAKTALEYAKYGALAMDLNAHGMLNDQPKEYYENLANGELRSYYSREPYDRDNYYFKWMFLRAQRAVDHLTENPLWDGKHIIVTGSSQGGAQCMFLAAVDPRITAAVVTVPAMLDQGGELQGRRNAWPSTMEKYRASTVENSPYFDPALLIGNTNAEIWCEVGLFDTTCPASGIFSALNQIKTKKTVYTTQRNHKITTNESSWHGSIDKARRNFISEALKK